MMDANDWKEMGKLHTDMSDKFSEKIDAVATHIHSKIDTVNKTLSDQNSLIGLVKAGNEGLYNKIEKHRLEPCPKIDAGITKHEGSDHKGIFGKALGYTVGIFTLLGMIIAGVWYLATH